MVDTYGPADALGLVGMTVDQVRFDACVDAGGFGLIYRGYHEGLGETVAIKCLRIASIQKTNAAIREALAGRFRDETKLLYRLSQGNLDIVRCISSGTLVSPKTNEYTPYMVLEWLDGCTLSAELKERRERRLGARNLRAAVNLLDSAALGLAYAHVHEVVHRDVKPGNLFLTRTREGVRIKVLDFGLAKILSDEAIGVRPSVETGVGVHFCSPSYGAPEQFTSQVGAIGPWTDVYSLCLVLLEVMTGEKVRPAGNLAQGLMAALDPEKGSPTASSLGLELPKRVEALLHRALAQNPKERPRDAGVFWNELKEAMNAPAVDEAPGPSMQQLRDAAVARADSKAPQASPLTGTLMMMEAPSMMRPAAPIPAAGRPVGVDPSAIAPDTAPLQPPLAPAGSHGQGTGTAAMTMPLGATSPLAASMAMPSPMAGYPQPTTSSVPPPGYGGQAQRDPRQLQSTPPPLRRPTPMSAYPPHGTSRPTPPEKPRTSAMLLVAAAVGVLFVIAMVALYLVRMRTH
ncbi:MAG: serine/threonine protein kinase [Labilithrix sp.]|nr:serine/threonine protein kinase [Labilithrix sp.]